MKITLSALVRCLALFGLLTALYSPAAITWDKKEVSLEVIRGSRDSVPTQFELRNTGTKPVTITGITTSCSCTTADPESSKLAAGEKTTLWVLFTIGARTGQQEKTITVTTDDPQSASTTLTLKVKLLEPATPAVKAAD
ncbi:DUF1573 domain-containing protein [Oleiharenicola lentus]|uniref:DUF1573 domain-containing protein n=1 Tax=Oleiharenicola lentus TaxID=2508720 RepID=UPI003F67C246